MARTKQTARISTMTPRAPIAKTTARRSARTAKMQAAAQVTAAATGPVSPYKTAPVPAAAAAAASPAPARAAAPTSRELELQAQLQKLQTQLDEQRRLHDNSVQHSVLQAIRQLQSSASASSSPSSASTSPVASSAASAASSSPSPSPLALSLPPTVTAAAVLPPDWPASQSHHTTLISLAPDHPDFVMVRNKLESTGLPKAGVLAVQRIYSRPLWERYVLARERVMLKHGNEALNTPASLGNEQLLWHGSRSNQPHLIYGNSDGFDTRMSGNGMLGPGSYFSRLASYSGISYAHPLIQPTYGNNGAKVAYKAAIPALYSTTAAGKLKVTKPPSNAFQMLLARVVLGTEYNARQPGQPHPGSYYSGRPPLRPFHCTGCNHAVDLAKLNVDTLRASLVESAGGRVTNIEEIEEEEEEPLGDAVQVVGGQKGKRKRVAAKAKASTSTAAAAPTAVGAAAAAAAPVPATPARSIRNTRRRLAAPVSTPASAPVAAPVVAAAAAPAVAPVVPAPVIAVSAAAGAAPPAAAASSAAAPSAPTPAPMDVSSAASAADATAASGSSAAAAASDVASVASPSSSASPAVPSFASLPVSCPKCSMCLGTRASLLASPYRFDSVTSDHMSVVYSSDAAYPEYLVTYTHNN